MSIHDPGPRGRHVGHDAAQPSPRPGRLTLPPRPGTLTAARLKVFLTLNAAELNTIAAPEGRPRVSLCIRLPDRTITAEIAAKSLRKAQTAIRDVGADNLALVLQGRLIAGDVVAEAGLSAQPKAAKPAQQRPTAGNDHGVGA
jgi:hypothetical protein